MRSSAAGSRPHLGGSATVARGGEAMGEDDAEERKLKEKECGEDEVGDRGWVRWATGTNRAR